MTRSWCMYWPPQQSALLTLTLYCAEEAYTFAHLPFSLSNRSLLDNSDGLTKSFGHIYCVPN